MRYKTMIVDDEPFACKVIAEYLSSISDFDLLAEIHSAEDAYLWLERQSIDLIFLDIHLPGISGLELLRKLRQTPAVIFTTAHPEFAVEAFEVEAFDYLLKPIAEHRFLNAMQKARKYLSGTDSERRKEKWINLKEGRRIYRVSKDEIMYLQAYGDYVRVFTRDKTYMVKDRLQSFVARLPIGFQKVHRSFIVNLESISFLEGNFVSINDEMIPVSESYKEQLHRVIRTK